MKNFSFHRAYLVLFSVATFGVIFGYTSLCSINEYLKSKRGVRGDFSPSKERALRKRAHITRRSSKYLPNKQIQDKQTPVS